MPEYDVPTPMRRRGRPQGGESGTRERMIAAAVEVFAESACDGTTMRASVDELVARVAPTVQRYLLE